MQALVKFTQITEADKVAKDVVTLFEANHRTVNIIRAMVDMEVKAASKLHHCDIIVLKLFLAQAGSLMRGNSMASKMMKSYSALIGKGFLRKVLGPQIDAICKNPKEGGAGFEVNPDALKPGEDLEKNKEKLSQTASKVLRTIFDSIDDTP